MIPNGTCPSCFIETSQNFPLCEKEISHTCTCMYTRVFILGMRLCHACDLTTDPPLRRVLRAGPGALSGTRRRCPSLLRSPLCRGASFSGTVPAPDDAQLALCPVFECHLPRAAVVDGGADFFIQAVPPRDLVSLCFAFFLMAEQPVSPVLKCGEKAEWTCMEPPGPVGTRPDIASLGAGKQRRSGGGADKGPAE